VDNIEKDMSTRGKDVIANLQTCGFNCTEWKNFLLIPCFVQDRVPKELPLDSDGRGLVSPSFQVLCCKQLSKIWPSQVVSLGAPYSSKKNFRDNYSPAL